MPRTTDSIGTVTIQELRRATAAVLRRVARGEWIMVLRRGKPVARLGPATEPGLHVGKRFGTGHRIVPFGHQMTRGAWLAVLAEDRGRRE